MSDQELSAEQMLETVRSDSAPKADAAPAPESAPAQSPFNPNEIEYTIEGGKVIKEPLDMIKKRAGMGYHYAQQMAVINQEREKYKGYDEKLNQLSRWQQYNDYAAQNPAWAKHVEESWNSRQAMQQSNTDQQTQVDPRIQTLEQQLAEISSFKNEWAEARQAETFKAQDKAFGSEIEATAKKFGVDFSQADEQGKSLEWRTLELMKDMGLDGSKPGHFEMAFKHMYFDNLMGKTKEAAKEEVAKRAEDLKKVGILGVSRTPTTARSGNAFNPKSSSWDDASKFALADMEAAKKAKA